MSSQVSSMASGLPPSLRECAIHSGHTSLAPPPGFSALVTLGAASQPDPQGHQTLSPTQLPVWVLECLSAPRQGHQALKESPRTTPALGVWAKGRRVCACVCMCTCMHMCMAPVCAHTCACVGFKRQPAPYSFLVSCCPRVTS